jgi:hypothetical protein
MMTWFNLSDEEKFRFTVGFKHLANTLSDDFHTQATPFPLCIEMVEKVGNEVIEEKDWLVIANLEFVLVVREYFKFRNWDFSRVSFATPCDNKAAFAKFLGIKNIIKYSYSNVKDWQVSKKFDVIIGNPPYGNLHLPILAKCVNLLSDKGISITVQPIRWLQDPLWNIKKSSDAKKYQHIFDGKIDSVEIIRNEDATEMFDALIGFDLGIITMKATGGKMNYEELSTFRGNINFGTTGRILQKNNFIKRHRRYDFTQKNFLPLITIAAAGSGRGLGTCANLKLNYGYFINGLSQNSKYGNGLTPEESFNANTRATLGKVTNWLCVEFDSEVELKNFYNFLKLEAFRFYILLTTVAVNIQCSYLPFPETEGAFLTPWDNQKFFDHFQLTPEEQNLIMDNMKIIDNGNSF